MKTKFIFIVFLCLNLIQANAQSNDEVTLVVSADGATKEEATKFALRSAIEQAYGTFVSANTTILNDDLVKDEIVTISRGNIKKYTEISSLTLPNGNTSVTLKAIVSLSKLISYAQNKGATTEFAGAAFGMDMKAKELNRKNEIIVFQHMVEKLRSIKGLFDYKLVLDNPRITSNNNYSAEGEIQLIYNSNTELFNEILFSTLTALSLSEEEKTTYEKSGISYYSYEIPYMKSYKDDYGYHQKYARVYLRNSYPTISTLPPRNIYKWIKYVRQELDNSGMPIAVYGKILGEGPWLLNEYLILAESAYDFIVSDNINSPSSLDISIDSDPKFDIGLWSYVFKEKISFGIFNEPKYKAKKIPKKGKVVGKIKINIKIPQEDIMKYSKFTINPR